ncbi:MAG: HAD family phosphatase [Chloroflexota bacterium]|nr:HAD family phosphatase [Chloroflexota bacterium]
MSGERAVLFDFGGVLLRQDWNEYDAFCERNGLPTRALRRALYGTDEWRDLQTGRISDRAVWRAAAIASLAEHCGDRAEGLFEEWYARPVALHQPNIELANALQAAGVRVGLLSNAAPDLETRLSTDFFVGIEFDDRVISGLVGLAKPDPAIYHLAAERIGLPETACFFIDDLEQNVEAARGVGMLAHHFQGDYEALHADLRAAGYEWE